MTQWAILYPVFVQVLLTFALMFAMGIERVKSIRSRDVSMRDVEAGDVAWPERPMLFGNSFRNQSELPILFYAVVGLSLIAGKVGGLMIILAWLFVLARVAHAYIHVVTNRPQQRFFIFLFGATCLLLMWFLLFLQVAVQGVAS